MLSSKKSKRKAFLFLLLLLPFLLFFFWWQSAVRPPSPQDSSPKAFVIRRGESLDSIARRLAQTGLIKSPAAFKLVVVTQGLAKKIQAGRFQLSPSQNLFQLAESLTHGTTDVWVTLPEGLRREEIAQRIAQVFSQNDASFDQDRFLALTQDLEGYLFPDTYLIPLTASADQVVSLLKDNFDQKFSQVKNRTSLSDAEVVILASLIEREVKHAADRPIVAGILLKRLEHRWPLQVDATIQYALGFQEEEGSWWKKNLTAADLQLDSSYNTYQNLGLPPTPICNPGLASLKAAANPQDSPYWFYLSDPQGNLHYAETLEQHQANIRRYLKKT